MVPWYRQKLILEYVQVFLRGCGCREALVAVEAFIKRHRPRAQDVVHLCKVECFQMLVSHRIRRMAHRCHRLRRIVPGQRRQRRQKESVRTTEYQDIGNLE